MKGLGACIALAVMVQTVAAQAGRGGIERQELAARGDVAVAHRDAAHRFAVSTARSRAPEDRRDARGSRYVKPVERHVTWLHTPGEELLEAICSENNKFLEYADLK